ncbi:hypothetical protein K7432_000396 [Basidiobolus ranarum]|uniref:Kinetochore protein SPC25 n=1 Tax=Basidiobolus ranarum TaxID=34480 RepID=A0ABR2X4P2_9FUNG
MALESRTENLTLNYVFGRLWDKDLHKSGTQEKEQKLTDLSNPEKNEIKMKLEKSQRILDEQTQEFQDVYSSIEEKKINVNDLKWKIETLQQEVTQLQEQRQSAEKKVLAISSKAQNQDPRVEKLCKWYRHANNGYREMVGVESVEMSSEAELVIRFKIPRFSNPALHIFIDPNTQTIEDASVVNWDGDITDIIDFAKRFDNLPFLIAQVRARILETSS